MVRAVLQNAIPQRIFITILQAHYTQMSHQKNPVSTDT